MCFSSHCLNNFAANRISNLELLVLEESHRQITQRKKISHSKEPTKNSTHMMLGLKPRTLVGVECSDCCTSFRQMHVWMSHEHLLLECPAKMLPLR